MESYNKTINFKKILIFSTKFCNYIAKSLKYVLEQNKIESEIIYDIDYKNPLLHIILFSQKVKVFPKNYIIYQLEQKDISNWINTKYELSIYHSIKSFDYSESNIDKFHRVLQNKISFFPIPLIPIELLCNNLNNVYNNVYNNVNNNVNINLLNIKPTNDILFYGSLNDIRLQKLNFLNKKLYPKYSIKILNNIYGDKLIYEILNSRIVINIHFYKNAILETCRINEILSCRRRVISETPSSIDFRNYEMYKDSVIFVDNMQDMFIKICETLVILKDTYENEIDFENHPVNNNSYVCDFINFVSC
jgi:hypothetical protein